MKSSCLLCAFLLLVVFLSIIPLASALQNRIAMKKCFYSYNDPNFGPWSEANQKGIFLNITNENPVEGSAPSYNYSIHTPVRDYNSSTKTYLPILVVNNTLSNMIYVNCTYIPFMRLWFSSVNQLAGPRFLSYDFGLNYDIVQGKLIYASAKNTSYIMGNYSSPVSIHDESSSDVYDSIYSFYNGLSSSTADGVFRYREASIITKLNLTTSSSGVVSSSGGRLFEQPGVSALASVDFWKVYFYINSTTSAVGERFNPSLIGAVFTNIDTGQSNSGGDCRVSKDCFLVGVGDKVRADFSWKNPYTFELLNKKIYSSIYTDPSGMGGVSLVRLDENGVSRLMAGAANLYNFSETGDSGDTNVIRFEVVIPSDKVTYAIGSMPYILENDGSYSNRRWYLEGFDDFAYLGFKSLDSQITLIDGKPMLKLDLSLLVLNNSATDVSVMPGDYALEISITGKNDSLTRLVYEEEEVLDGDALKAMGFPSGIPDGHSAVYTFPIDIGSGNFNIQNAKYEVKVYSKKLGIGRFGGKRLATLLFTPYFRAGKIQQAADTDFYFTPISRDDFKTIQLFNPDFSPHKISLSYYGLTDAKNFSIALSASQLTLAPLETRNFMINVSAKYVSGKWPAARRVEHFYLLAESDQGGDVRTEVEYNLNVGESFVQSFCGIENCSARTSQGYNVCLALSGCTCTWNYTGSGLLRGRASSPPGSIFDGNCTICPSSGYLGCSFYNNNQSCARDNCKLAGTGNICVWDNIYGCATKDKDGCVYYHYRDCSSGSRFGKLKWVLIPGGAATCSASKEFVIPCEESVELPFFSSWQLVFALIFVLGIYFLAGLGKYTKP